MYGKEWRRQGSIPYGTEGIGQETQWKGREKSNLARSEWGFLFWEKGFYAENWDLSPDKLQTGLLSPLWLHHSTGLSISHGHKRT